jgi:hypothetical protein
MIRCCNTSKIVGRDMQQSMNFFNANGSANNLLYARPTDKVFHATSNAFDRGFPFICQIKQSDNIGLPQIYSSLLVST